MTKIYKRILLDIDNTLTELQPTLDKMAAYFGVPSVDVSKVNSFHLAKAFNVTEEEEKIFWKTQELELCKMAILSQERVNTILDVYTDDRTEIYVITHRTHHYEAETSRWLNENHIPFKKLLCVGMRSKVELVKDLQIEAVFEDNPSFFYDLWEENLFHEVDSYCIDYAFNQHVPCYKRIDRQSGLELSGMEMTHQM